MMVLQQPRISGLLQHLPGKCGQLESGGVRLPLVDLTGNELETLKKESEFLRK